MKKAIAVLLVVFMLTGFSGCELTYTEVVPKTFSSSGMTITLTDKFYEKEMRSYTACYDSAHVAVFALKEEFSLMEDFENYSLQDYAQLVLDNNEKDSEINIKDDLTYFIFDSIVNGKNCRYFCSVYKGADAFWLIQFSCVVDDYEEYQNNFIAWAQSVEV